MRTELIHQEPAFFADRSIPYSFRYRRVIMSAFLLFSDALLISSSIIISISIWKRFREDIQVDAHLNMIIPAVIFFAFIYGLLNLYPAIGIGPVEELRRLTISTFFVILSLITITFFLRTTYVFSRATLIISWLLITTTVPISRKVFRRIAVKMGLWGIPTMIVGNKKSVIYFHKRLKEHPLTGFWPVLCISGPIQEIFPREGQQPHRSTSNIQTLIIADDGGKLNNIRYLVTQKKHRFRHIILLFNERRSGPIWFTPVTMMEYMGLEVVHNLLNSVQKNVKRLTEFLLIILSIPVLLILFIGIALLIKANSPGPIFYRHQRVGLDGKPIWIWKFRTMAYNADTLLKGYLWEDPALQEEWNKNFKLKVDPRITQIGRLLRRTSLDELPQVWNVLKGEMSLIGPRPIVEEEIPLYGDDFEIYKQVRPGITGLWQISGRNNLPYQDRVTLDIYYIQNWSIWLDVHILMHTVLATLQARGAY